jgi:hypothetical protein
MSPSTGRGGVSRDNLITGMSMNAVRNKKKNRGHIPVMETRPSLLALIRVCRAALRT